MKNTLFRAGVVIFMIYAIVVAVMTLQYFFDRGDMKKASRVVYEAKLNGKDTLVDLMALDLKIPTNNLQNDLHCETQIQSRYEGRVLVECGAAQGFQALDSLKNYQWIVDVVASRVQPQNQKAQYLFEILSQKK